MSENIQKVETLNPGVQEIRDEYIRQIFEAGVIYRKFSESLKSEKDLKIYMISKKILDDFKQKIKYEENKEYFSEKDQEKNFQKIEDQLNKFSVGELESIIFTDIKIFGDLGEIETNFNIGFDFVNEEFLDKLEFNIENKESAITYNKEKNNTIIIFGDKSKLLINENNGVYKYHVIPPPIKEINIVKSIYKTKTFVITNKDRIKTIKK
jgi:hypothetical protein